MSDDLQGLTARQANVIRPYVAMSGARVYNTSLITLTNATYTAVTFDSERFDDASYHDTATNSSRLTVPYDGRYLIGAHIGFDFDAGGGRQVRLRVNGATTIATQGVAPVPDDNNRISICTIWEMTALDYVEVLAYQTTGGPLNLEQNQAFSMEFWIWRLA